MDTPKEGFASRWSRLKRDPAEEVPAEAESEVEAVAEDGPPDAELSDLELLEKYALPDPDTMKSGDDFSAFMKQAIPDRLRRRALRVLWGSNPALANLDELVDYGEDFTDAATVVENMQTIYQVGKGSAWKYQEEQARIAAEKAAAEAEAAERRAEEGEPEEEVPDEPEALPDPEDMPEEPVLAALPEEPDEAPPPLPRRPRPMRFEFEG